MTTIVLVRKNNEVVVAGDGQVSMGNTVIKKTANKVRKIEKRNVIAGFAGSTADALTLFERLESKLEKHSGNLARAAVELAKDWRTDKYLRRLEALMAVGDKENSFIISGTGDVLEPEEGIIGIGSGGNYALAAAKVLMDSNMSAEDIAKKLEMLAHVSQLRRKSVGNFCESKMVKLSILEDLVQNNNPTISDYFIAIDEALTEFSVVSLNHLQSSKFRNGQQLEFNGHFGDNVKVYDHNNKLVGVAHKKNQNILAPKRIFHLS